MILNEILKKDVVRQFISFCMVGVVGVTVNYTIFFILYRFFSIYYIISSGTGFVCSIFVAFSLNKKFTFNNRNSDKTKIQLMKYFFVNIFSMTIGLIFLRIFVELFHINVYIANLFVIGIQTISNFTGSRLFAFR